MISKTETFNLTVYCGLHWQPTPIFRCFPKPSHYHNKRHLYDLLQEIPRVLVALCQEWEQRPNIYFLFKNLYIYTHFFFFFCFLGPHPQHTEVPRLGVKSKLQLLAYITARVTWDLSHVCNLHHSSQQPQILSPLNKIRDWNHILMDTSQVCYC